ncbi:mediator of RNA polymerase II transcription subunit 15a-like isoform X2 [Ananas comosus]|uniref:Mediator of RNA polymerase II transcription subunit 15a-like isoform X2 n=1 Tax=Ananas comosus TaxID=4615 RepID=A0A6P5F4Y2_ANACO|nr:mediator of RNA polymerase II transcription subunit 15a-like isoform X2 [Ananas comosus]
MEPIAAATADWRAQVPPSARQSVVDKIGEILLSRLHISEPERCKEIQRIAVRFEEQIFTIATSQSDYLKKVCLKLFSIELKTQHAPLTNSAMTDAAVVPESSIYPAHGIQSQVSCDMLLAHQASASLLQPHGADDQQKLIMWSQTSLPEVSLNALVGSTAENEHADGIDWQQEIYDKIKTMKELYFVELIELYKMIALKIQQHDILETPGNLSDRAEKMKKFLEGILVILQLDKSDVQIALKDKLLLYEKEIMRILASHKRKVPAQQPQGQSQFLQPSLCAHTMPQQQPAEIPNSSVVSSSSMPVPSSSIQEETEKQFSNVASLPNAGQNGHQLTTLPPPALLMPGMSASSVLAEIACPNGNQPNIPTSVPCQASATETPLVQLLEVISQICVVGGERACEHVGSVRSGLRASGCAACFRLGVHILVQSANPEALCCAVNAIGSVVTMMDGMAVSAPFCGSRGALGEDLAAATYGSLQGRSFMSIDGNTAARKMKRDIDAMSLNNVSFVGGANDSSVQSYSPGASELVPTMKSHDKRKKTKVNHAPTEKYDQKNRGGGFDSSDAVWEHCVGA